MAKKTPRAGRTLIIFGIAVALAVRRGGPRQGLEARSWASTSRAAPGSRSPRAKAPTQTQLKLAAAIIDQRVNGSGVSESEVSTQGSKNIVVEIPGKQRKDLSTRSSAPPSCASGWSPPAPRSRGAAAAPERTVRVALRQGVAERHPEQEGHGQAEQQVHRRRHCHAEAARRAR